jgi:hypothetical protein
MATSFDNTKPSRRAALASIGKGMMGAVTVSALTASVAKCTGSAHAATIHRSEWQTAYAAWLPIHEEWERLGDAAFGDDSIEPAASIAWAQLKQRLPTFQRVRDALMKVRAPDAHAFLAKLEIAACSTDAEHIESCLADARLLFAREA